ncbi:MAG: hypothetical protein ACRDU0_14620, partial [Mycobacterium sp.]
MPEPAAPQLLLVVTNPGKMIEVLPAGAGRLLVSVTVNDVPSVTISVGPGSCISGQNPIAANCAGAKVGVNP